MPRSKSLPVWCSVWNLAGCLDHFYMLKGTELLPCDRPNIYLHYRLAGKVWLIKWIVSVLSSGFQKGKLARLFKPRRLLFMYALQQCPIYPWVRVSPGQSPSYKQVNQTVAALNIQQAPTQKSCRKHLSFLLDWTSDRFSFAVGCWTVRRITLTAYLEHRHPLLLLWRLALYHLQLWREKFVSTEESSEEARKKNTKGENNLLKKV